MFINKRLKIDRMKINQALDVLQHRIDANIQKHGDGTFVSDAEIMGVLQEEITECYAEMHKNNETGLCMELYDVAAAALTGIVSIEVARNHESD